MLTAVVASLSLTACSASSEGDDEEGSDEGALGMEDNAWLETQFNRLSITTGSVVLTRDEGVDLYRRLKAAGGRVDGPVVFVGRRGAELRLEDLSQVFGLACHEAGSCTLRIVELGKEGVAPPPAPPNEPVTLKVPSKFSEPILDALRKEPARGTKEQRQDGAEVVLAISQQHGSLRCEATFGGRGEYRASPKCESAARQVKRTSLAKAIEDRSLSRDDAARLVLALVNRRAQ